MWKRRQNTVLVEREKPQQLLGTAQKFFNTAKLIFRLFITVTVDSNKKTDGVILWITYPTDLNWFK